MLGLEELEKRTKELSSIRQKQYYCRVVAEAERQRIVKKVMTKGGRVGVLLLPPQ